MADLISLTIVVVFVLTMISIFWGWNKISSYRYKKKLAKTRAAFTCFFSIYDEWYEQHELKGKCHSQQWRLEEDIDKLIKEQTYLLPLTPKYDENCYKIKCNQEAYVLLQYEEECFKLKIKQLSEKLNEMDKPKHYDIEYH